VRKKWFALGCFTSLVLLVGTIYLIGYFANKSIKGSTQKVLPNSYLHLKLSGQVIEYSKIADDFFNKEQTTVFDIVQKIKKARYDDNISGIVIEPQFVSIGFASTNEILKALEDFKKSGKNVVAYISYAGNKDYMLCSGANKIYLNPSMSSGILLTGIGSKMTFYKELLNKIGVDIHVVQSGKFKGAGENFSRSEMSEPLKESISGLFAGIYDEMTGVLASNRGIPVADVKKIFEERELIFINGQEALDYKLVDQLSYREDFLKEYNLDEEHMIDLKKSSKLALPVQGSQIAVLYANGTIAQQRSGFNFEGISAHEMNSILDDITENEDIRAVVIRVNSPGGSALESDIILEKISRLKEKKPVVISMGDVAASGGYYISCASDYIFADPFTITGSIGVVSMFPNFSKLGDKIGVNSDGVTFGKYSNFLNPWEPINERELQEMQIFSERVYTEFKAHVANSRKLTMEEVEEIAQGRVWNTQDALNLKLIDAKGSLDDAVIKAASIANLVNYEVSYFPDQKTMLELIMKERFNLDVITDNLLKAKTKKIGANKAIELYEEIQNDPVQMRLPMVMNQ